MSSQHPVAAFADQIRPRHARQQREGEAPTPAAPPEVGANWYRTTRHYAAGWEDGVLPGRLSRPLCSPRSGSWIYDQAYHDAWSDRDVYIPDLPLCKRCAKKVPQ